MALSNAELEKIVKGLQADLNRLTAVVKDFAYRSRLHHEWMSAGEKVDAKPPLDAQAIAAQMNAAAPYQGSEVNRIMLELTKAGGDQTNE